MPVPEIDRLAHEILDILGTDLADSERPDDSGSLRQRAFIAIATEVSEVDSAREPLVRRCLERLQTSNLAFEHGPAVWDYASREFQARPSLALLGLYLALERAEMQERATPTPNLDADDPSLLPASGNALNDMSRHGAEGTR